MGDPAELSIADRREAIGLAKRVIQSVIDDASFPLSGLSSVAQGELLRMCQTLLEHGDCLARLDHDGGLGIDVHERIRLVLGRSMVDPP